MPNKRTLHGDTNSPEYHSWSHIIDRCCNPKNAAFDRYGGRGITVCERWRNSYSAFLQDMGRRPSSRHSLDRYPDNDGNYEPGNCRWATHKEQNQNRRDNNIITAFGKRLCLSEWSRVTGIHHYTICTRLRRGWTPEVALSKSPRAISSGPNRNIQKERES